MTGEANAGGHPAMAERVALVTGAAGGIGRAIALRLADARYAIALNDMDPAGAAQTAAEVRARGVAAVPIVADVGDRDAARRMVEEALGALGRLDVLVNNAGVCRLGSIAEFPEADWRATFRVNVDGVFYCCQAVLPHMTARGRGSIVNIASWSGKSGAPYFGPYCASKFAVVGLTQSLAREVGGAGSGSTRCARASSPGRRCGPRWTRRPGSSGGPRGRSAWG